jgi:hypothetical protein
VSEGGIFQFFPQIKIFSVTLLTIAGLVGMVMDALHATMN